MLRAGGTSTRWSSTRHDAGLAVEPDERAGDRVVAARERDEVDVVPGEAGGGLAHLDAALGRHLRRVHVRHRLVGHRAEQALQHRQGEDAGVVVGQLALVLDRRGVPATPSASAPKRLPSRSASGRNGRTVSVASAALTFTANGTNSPARARPDLLGDRVARLVLRLAGAGPEVRGDDDLGQVEQRRLGGRLAGEHVERGAADAAVADGVGQRVLVDDPAARHVDDALAGLGLGQVVGADHPDRLGGLDDVEGDEVGHARPARRGRAGRC